VTLTAPETLSQAPGESTPSVRRLLLASRSPRRRELLHSAGFEHGVIDARIDDGQLSPGDSTALDWVAALSYLKARAGWDCLTDNERRDALVLGADTVVEKHGEIIGQPRDEADARRIITLLENGEHRVLTGVTLLCAEGDETLTGVIVPMPRRRTFTDAASVRVGEIGEARVTPYLVSCGWRGKAGGYNLSERIADGWPITFTGDPGTIMGLPIQRLAPMLRELLAMPSHRS
jgi:septum formation protein